jgi:hypothetical protein
MVNIRWNKEWGIPAVTGVASFVVGTGFGYFVAAARLSKKVKEVEANQKLLREYIESTRNPKEPTLAESREDEKPMIQQTETDDIEDMVEIEIDPVELDDPAVPYLEEERLTGIEPFHTRIFSDDSDDDDWDYEVEVQKRSDDKPYIIHRDEFMAEESGFRQSSLTYYAGDNILCDEKDEPIYNHELISGTLRFGHGSKDISIVYVRNPILESEYEIILDHGHYQVEVLGAVIEDEMSSDDLKHSIHRFKKD